VDSDRKKRSSLKQRDPKENKTEVLRWGLEFGQMVVLCAVEW
jgi:hypothetical protein